VIAGDDSPGVLLSVGSDLGWTGLRPSGLVPTVEVVAGSLDPLHPSRSPLAGAEEGQRLPVPSWQIYRELLARSGRSASWVTAATWALDRLQVELGPSWPERATRAEDPPPLAQALAWINGNTLAMASVLEWALGFHVLRDCDGIADLRREAGANATAGRGLHTALQLELAGLATRLGWAVALEPGGSPPADVAMTTPDGRLVVEARVLTQSQGARTQVVDGDALTARLQTLARRHDLWLAGEIERRLDLDELAVIETWIRATRAAPADLRFDGVALHLTPGSNPSGAFRSPGIEEDLGPRMAREIAAKAVQMEASGATWLRIALLTGLWPMTLWGRAPLEHKLESMSTWLSAALGDAQPDGIVLSSAAAFFNGTVVSETVRSQHGAGVRRAIAPLRARETLIIPRTPAGDEAVARWVALADAETDYLGWALRCARLPTVSQIFG
jgi:hypothetical protein